MAPPINFLLLVTVFSMLPIYLSAQPNYLVKGEDLTFGQRIYSDDSTFYLTVENLDKQFEGETFQQIACRTYGYDQLVYRIEPGYGNREVSLVNRDGKACIDVGEGLHNFWCSDEAGDILKLSNTGQIVLLNGQQEIVWKSPEVRSIEGKVTNLNGGAISNVEIAQFNLEDPFWTKYFLPSTYSDEDGNYSLYTSPGEPIRFYKEKYEQLFLKPQTSGTFNVTMPYEKREDFSKTRLGPFIEDLNHLELGYYKNTKEALIPFTKQNAYLLEVSKYEKLPAFASSRYQSAIIQNNREFDLSDLGINYTCPAGAFFLAYSHDFEHQQSIAIRYKVPADDQYEIHWESILFAFEEGPTDEVIVRGKKNGQAFSMNYEIAAKMPKIFTEKWDLKKGDYIEFLPPLKKYGKDSDLSCSFFVDVKRGKQYTSEQATKVVNTVIQRKNYIPEAKNASIQKEMDVETVNNKSFGGFISGLDPTKKISAGISLEDGEGIYPVGCAGLAGLVLIVEEADGSSKKLSSQEELSKYFAPVDSPEEAFSFAHLQEGGRPLQNLPSDEPLYDKVQNIPPITAYSDGSYEVVMTVSDPCMHEYYPALRYYLVEKDGTVSASSSSFSQN